jgi:hypothetical protein
MKNLLTKLLLVQKDIKPIEKDSINPHFKSKYFDINSLIAELKPILSKHGLVVLQPLGQGTITTYIFDSESGEEMHWDTKLPDTQDPQKMGAMVSYLRRYSLTSLFVLEGEEDNDGNTIAAKTVPTKEFHITPSNAVAPKCAACGAGTKWSTKSGKFYCEKLCWTKPKQELPTINVDEVDSSEIPF